MFIALALAAYSTFSSPTLSVDGTTMAWLRTQNRTSHVELQGKYANDLRRSIGAGSVSSLALSPSGERVALLSDRETPGQDQLFVTSGKSSLKRLTSMSGDLSAPQWSPDGRFISLLVINHAEAAAGPLSASQRPWGVIGEGHADIQQLVVFETATGRIRYTSPRTAYIYEAVWSPRSDRIAITTASGRGDFDNWYVATLNVVDLPSGRERVVVKSRFQLAQPAWIDDTRIAYITGLMSDVVSPGGDVASVDVISRKTRMLISDPGSGSATHLWRCGATVLCMRLYQLDTTALASYDVVSGAFRVRRDEPENITTCAADAHGDFLISSEAFDHPAEMVFVGRTTSRRLDGQLPAGRTWSDATNTCWRTDAKYCGWVLWPAHRRSAKVPLLVYVHGGPGYNSPPFWPHQWATDVLRDELARGVAVFFPNYRGSFGFGEQATRDIQGSVGRGDVADVLAGVDAVIKRGGIDEKHLAIYGNSFGGSIALASIGQSNRFVAAVAGEAVTDWYSYSGQNGIESEVPFFLKPYFDDPIAYIVGSPIYYVRRVRTPTLLLQGDADQEVPTLQPYEYWRALKARGISTRFRIFHNEGHAYSDPVNRLNFSQEAESWLNLYLH